MKFIFGVLFFSLSSFLYAQQSSVSQGEEVVVTARRFPESLQNYPVNVTVINAEKIQNSAAATLPELLSHEAGINIRSLDGSPNLSIDMRGLGVTGDQNTLILLDGQRLSDPDLSPVKWGAIPLSEIERIEIMRGGGSVMYGEGAVGGTINIITKKATQNVIGSVSVIAGDYDTRALQGGVNVNTDRFSFRVYGQDYRSDNYRINNRDEERNAGVEARLFTEKGELNLALGSDNQILRLPGVRKVNPTTGINDLVNDPRGTATHKDYASRDGERIKLGYKNSFGNTDALVDISKRTKSQQSFFGDYTSGGAFDSYSDTNIDLLSFNPRLRTAHRLFGFENSLVWGFDHADWDYNSKRATRPETLNVPSAHILASQKTQGVYFSNETKFSPRTTLTLGMRKARSRYDAKDVVNSASYARASQRRDEEAYEIGIRQKLGNTNAIFARVGRSFRFATVDEIFSAFGGPSFDSIINILEPQSSVDREIGFDHQDPHSRVRAAFYYMNLNNELHYNAITFTNMNLSPTRRYGLELDGSRKINDCFEMGANYTYAVAKFVEGVYSGTNVAGNDIPLVPKHALSVSGSYLILPQTRLSATVNYVGQQRFDNDQTNTFNQKMPAYKTVDLKLVQQKKNWTWSAGVYNLLNEKYFTYAIRSTTQGVYNAYPMKERYALFSLQYEFK